VRGYLERAVDEEDRRKLTITLTPRERAAAAVQGATIAKIDKALTAAVGKEHVAHTRRTLAALIDMAREDGEDDDH
jgi:DNA-binding MarR family transcriptional regulator